MLWVLKMDKYEATPKSWNQDWLELNGSSGPIQLTVGMRCTQGAMAHQKLSGHQSSSLSQHSETGGPHLLSDQRG